MKNLKIYYVVDTLAEKVIGSFTAPNKEYAEKIFDDFCSDEKNHVHSCVFLVDSQVSYISYETFDELRNAVDFNVWKPVEVKDVNNSDSDGKN